MKNLLARHRSSRFALLRKKGYDAHMNSSGVPCGDGAAKYAVIFEKTDTGYSAYAPDLPGCVAAGATIEETEKLMRGAIEMHIEGMREDGEPVPEPTTIARNVEIPIQPAA